MLEEKKNSENRVHFDFQNFSELIKNEIIFYPNPLHRLQFPL